MKTKDYITEREIFHDFVPFTNGAFYPELSRPATRQVIGTANTEMTYGGQKMENNKI